VRVSRQQAEQNRERIVDTAAPMFRESGFDRVGIDAIMKSAGLTHGGFYGHFACKDDPRPKPSSGRSSAVPKNKAATSRLARLSMRISPRNTAPRVRMVVPSQRSAPSWRDKEMGFAPV
jgi:Bacterial regulatory proteins, tetR family